MEEQERERLILAIAGHRVRWRLAPIRAENWSTVLFWAERIGATVEAFNSSSPAKGESLERGRFTYPAEWANPGPRGERVDGGTGWVDVAAPDGALTETPEQPWVDGYAAIQRAAGNE